MCWFDYYIAVGLVSFFVTMLCSMASANLRKGSLPFSPQRSVGNDSELTEPMFMKGRRVIKMKSTPSQLSHGWAASVILHVHARFAQTNPADSTLSFW